MTSIGKRFFSASYWSATWRTRPMSTPRRSIDAPGARPRTEGSWSIAGGEPRTAAAHCEWLIREPASGSFASLADAHRRGVARLGADLGAALARAKRGEAPSCPAQDPAP